MGKRASSSDKTEASGRSSRSTLSQRAMQRPRVAADDALRLARRHWLAGGRIDMGRLAAELGVARATLFRWYGSRDALLAEVLWSLSVGAMQRAAERYPEASPAQLAERCAAVVRQMAGFAPLRRFIAEDSERALRLLTSSASPLQARVVDALRAWLAQAAEIGGWQPQIEPETLAYLLVRLGESFLYARAISGRDVELDDCRIAFELLLSGRCGERPPLR